MHAGPAFCGGELPGVQRAPGLEGGSGVTEGLVAVAGAGRRPRAHLWLNRAEFRQGRLTRPRAAVR
ncbi:hypothetical protein GCM10010324_64080 [Streptomyces hiroshimensis]|uniref:Uncharacterized protein n=1 Tax=Streptomyces hiroshimensis TaxID=66424 RepID=A0ABQ2ZCS4_9ACTN|nr:hypothetical protein GCM10010324_64080 [Streptomyces hiroshimensis]